MILTVGCQNKDGAISFETQTWMVMKLTIAFLLFLNFQISASGHAQQITIVKKNATLTEIFKAIEEQSGYLFFYDKAVIQNTAPIDIAIKKATLEQALSVCLKDQGLTYSIVKNTVVIRPEKKSVYFQTPATLTPIGAHEPPPVELRGRVVNKKGVPLQGASILVVRTKNGTTTNNDGRFTLTVPNGENIVLEISSVGYQTKRVNVGKQTEINVSLDENMGGLGEVVITALGISKERKSLTYATQQVSNAEINKVKDVNLMNSLAGKVAGAVITRGTMGPGSATRVLIRGDKSFTGNSAPLYVIDGVPSSRGDILNPDDIQSIEVLPGASAAALYGSQAANGVILINTKEGKKGVPKISVTSDLTVDEVSELPKLQTKYGQADPRFNDSWGGVITNGSDRHLKEFFNTGLTKINSVSLSSGNDIAQVYLSYSNISAKGVLPENHFLKNSFFVKANTQVFNGKLSIEGSVNYFNQKIYNQNSTAGYVDNPMGGNSNAYFGLISFPAGDDWSKYSGANYEVWDPVRQMYVQNWGYLKDEAITTQNPYWVQKKNQLDNFLNYFTSSLKAKYKMFSWLDIQGRITYEDSYSHFEKRNYASSSPTYDGNNGGYGIRNSKSDNFYSDLMLLLHKNINEDFRLSGALGFVNTENTISGLYLATTNTSTLQFPNYFSVYALNGLFDKSESLMKSASQALFANATIGFKDKVFLDVTGRNEWASSTLYKPFFYPSVGLSYILKNSVDGLFSFAKVRASYAEVGKSLPFGIDERRPPYALRSNGSLIERGSLPYFNGTDTVNLKPERTKSYEFGADLRFFENKLKLNLTFFNATSYDQVFQIQAPAGSGAASFWINGGVIRNRGFEGILSYNASFGGIKWTPSISFSHYKNRIMELSSLLKADYFVLSSFNSTRLASLYLTRPKDGKYGSYGDLFGKVYERDDHGVIKTDSLGFPMVTSTDDNYIGNANPDFMAGINNTFTYKNFSLSFLIDSRFGGGVISRTQQWLDYKGFSKRTGDARDAGGVMFGGKLLDAHTFYLNQTSAGQEPVASAYFYDATNIRMREVSFGYSFPVSGNIFKSINISAIGRNLFLIYKNAPFDPETGGTVSQRGEGFDNFHLPATRSYGLNLSLGF